MRTAYVFVVGMLLLGLFGCSNTARTVRRVVTGPPPATAFVTMDFRDTLALQMNRYRLDPAWILVLRPKGDLKGLGELAESGYKIVFAPLRNPGSILIFTGRGGRAVNPGDEADISRLVTAFGGTVLKSGIPYQFGPDGKTPMITKPVGVYAPAPNGEPMDFVIEISYSDLKSAQATVPYVDPSFYKAVIRKEGKTVILRVTATISRGGEHDEEEIFREVAKLHGGKIDWYGGQ